ncbi:MAG TPA: hypothetical protein VHP33_04265 [Polyangiaceae bacterium]|nr:hypothetical protein [Polyangiaceae bacterium]
MGSVGALLAGVSCYRAEVDLAPLLDDTRSGAGGSASGGTALGGGAGDTASFAGERGGGESGAGGELAIGRGGAGGSAAAPECDPTPDEPIQAQCRLRPPAKLVCDEQDKPGWAGCYNGGCSICTEVLVEFPYYLTRHPCCGPNTVCGVHSPLLCSPLCPPPTELDKKPPCYELER